ncbi:pannexin-1 [Nannospalax galili]|nr:pannexin-1 [Nannospalax galili]
MRTGSCRVAVRPRPPCSVSALPEAARPWEPGSRKGSGRAARGELSADPRGGRGRRRALCSRRSSPRERRGRSPVQRPGSRGPSARRRLRPQHRVRVPFGARGRGCGGPRAGKAEVARPGADREDSAPRPGCARSCPRPPGPGAMAIAHLATEYVFSDFLLKEPTEPKFKGLRLELAVDKMVTCIAVGLPLLLISLAFAQEISIGTQLSCFSPSSFSWRQASFVDSYCWAAVQQKSSLQSEAGNLPLWLHKFFPYILLLFAILLYLPPLFWRFAAAPHLCSDLKFIMEELDKVYNRAIKAAKSARDMDLRDGVGPPTVNENVGQSLWEISESHFKYPIVEQYLKTKKSSGHLIMKYISCRVLTFTILLLACVYLSYYFSLSSLSDEFVCSIKSGVLKNDSSIPDRFQCKLIAVGIFQLLSFINLVMYALLVPVVVYTLFVPFRQKTDVLKVYEILPTFDVLHFKSEGYNDLSLYNLFLEENVSELKSYKCLKVLESIKSSGQGLDPMLLLTNLGMIKMDVIDGKSPMSVEAKGEGQGSRAAELKDPDMHSETINTEKNARQRLLNSSC